MADTPNASTVTYYLDETVKQLSGPLSTMIPDIQAVLDLMRKDLLEPVYNISAVLIKKSYLIISLGNFQWQKNY